MKVFLHFEGSTDILLYEIQKKGMQDMLVMIVSYHVKINVLQYDQLQKKPIPPLSKPINVCM
jgi:hypothetical protein